MGMMIKHNFSALVALASMLTIAKGAAFQNAFVYTMEKYPMGKTVWQAALALNQAQGAIAYEEGLKDKEIPRSKNEMDHIKNNIKILNGIVKELQRRVATRTYGFHPTAATIGSAVADRNRKELEVIIAAMDKANLKQQRIWALQFRS